MLKLRTDCIEAIQLNFKKGYGVLMSRKILVLFFISLFPLFSAVSIKSQEGDSLYYIDPNAFVAREIFNKKIVMLGDNGHHQPGVYHYLIGVLNKWLEQCDSRQDEENLTLIVENDSLMAKAVNEYIKSGNMQALVEKINSEFYLEVLEYYTNLRKFSLKIDSLNQYRDKKISFKVKAFEQGGYVSFERVVGLPQKEHELWFVNERDSVTAEGIINYVNSNPNEQILIFYGGAHLIERKVNKIGLGQLEMVKPEEGLGYFLAYFLDKEFGAENVVKFVTWGSSLHKYAKKQDFPYPGRKNFIAKAVDLNIEDSLVSKKDFIYLVQFDYLPLIEGRIICSKFIFDKILKQIKYFKANLPGNVAKRYFYSTMYNIYLLTGIYDTTLFEYTAISDFDEMNWLYNDKLGDMFLGRLNRIPDDKFREVLKNYYANFFTNYGISYWTLDSSIKYSEKEKWINNNFPSIMNQLKFTNSIGIYWFGYPDEKIKAKEYLVKFSGEDFAEPEKYLQWYRMKYYGYKY